MRRREYRSKFKMGEPVSKMVSWARREKTIAGLFVALTLVVGILIGTIVSDRTSAMKSVAFAGKGATLLAMPDAIPSSNSFASIVNRVEPAVVNISTTQVMEKRQSTKKRRVPQQPNDQQPDNPNDPMQDFFDRFFDGRQDAPPAAERSLGSGVIVDRKGFILTNNHVVDQATKIQVQLNGETTKFNAKVGFFIHANDFCIEFCGLAIQLDLNLGRLIDNVIVRKDKSLSIDDYARTQAAFSSRGSILTT